MDQGMIRKDICDKVRDYYSNKTAKFVPGETMILTGMAVYDDKEVTAIIESLLDGWLGLGKKGLEFEKQFAKYTAHKHGVFVNSGSSANLLALHSIKIKDHLCGGEIIAPACAFPTTFNPIIQLGFKPAIIDVDESLNITPEGVLSAINKNTKGIMFAHTLGNPARVGEIRKIADEHKLFLIEDCCDALGSKYEGQFCGTFGNIATFSFYPAHGITMGEGGCLSVDDIQLDVILRSLRDWGRACFCTTDEKNPLGKCLNRFNYKIGDVPYDHKYVYSTIGYNMKPLELQAAMGLEQLKRIDGLNDLRKRNFELYKKKLAKHEQYFSLPKVHKLSEPVFFGLPIVIKDERINRKDFIEYLNEKKIGTRLVFGGNLLMQPAYKDIDYAKYSELSYTDKIMRDCFWIGVHPGITPEMIDYVVATFDGYFEKLKLDGIL